MEEKVLAKSKRIYEKEIKLLAIVFTVLALLSWCCLIADHTALWEFVWKYIVFRSIVLLYGAPAVWTFLCVIFLIIYFSMRESELVITDKRVYGKAAFGRQVDLPLDSISAIGTMWFSGLSVASSSGKIAFVGLSNRNELQAAISGLLVNRQSKPAATTTIKQEIPQSNADELKKYKDLLDSGVISQEEFDAKKKQLLGV